MERDFYLDQRKLEIESLANELILSHDVINEDEMVYQIANSGLVVCVQFYEKYVKLVTEDNDYWKFRGMQIGLYSYFEKISRSTNPEVRSEIFEILSGSNEYSFDKSIAANPNPSIRVELLRKIGNKKYEQSNKGFMKRQIADFRNSTRDSLLTVAEFMNQSEMPDLRVLNLDLSIQDGLRPSLKWIVKENILKRQQLILQEFTNIFGGEIDPIYKNIDKYDILETCGKIAKLIYPSNNSSSELDPNRRFEETIMDVINPSNKDGIPCLLSQMEVYTNGLNIGQKRFFGRPRLLELCNTILEVDLFSLNKSYPNRDKYELSGILFQCLNNPFEDEGKNKNYKVWSVYGGYCSEFTRVNKISRESVIEKANSRSNNNSDYKIIFKQPDLNYENSDTRSDKIERILLSLQKDRNFLRKLLEELLKEPLPTSEQILFAENAELESQKLADPEKQGEVWYEELKDKIYDELIEDSEQEDILYQHRIEGLFKNADYLQSEVWSELKPGIDKIFEGNKRVIILLNKDLLEDQNRIKPNSQLRDFWRDLNINFDAKSDEEKDYSKYIYITTQLLIRLRGKYEEILVGLNTDEPAAKNDELTDLLNLEIELITATLASFTVFSE